MKNPLVSVIIPAYNGVEYIADAIQSVLRQTYKPIEILVVDNASKDQTAEIVKSFPSVRYIFIDKADTAFARNQGIIHANGSLLAFLDQDDIWSEDKLSKQVDFLEKNPTIYAVVCRQKMFLQEGHRKPHWLKRELLESDQPAYLPSALLIKKEILEKTSLFNTSYSLVSDVAWFFKAKHSGIEVPVLPETLLLRRIHNNNTSNFCIDIQKEILSIIRSSLQERREKISVIICVWNGEKYVAEAIQSVLDQDYKNIEVIVVNDGSTDSTQKIIDSFGSRICSIQQANLGAGAARNAGVNAAHGDYIAFLDHDDLWEKTKLSSQMKLTSKEDPLIFGFARQFICSTLTIEEKNKIVLRENLMPGYVASTLLVSKKRFLEIGLFPEGKIVGEFIDWYDRALRKNVPVVMLSEVTLHRRIHTHNMGRQNKTKIHHEYLHVLKNCLERRRKSDATTS